MQHATAAKLILSDAAGNLLLLQRSNTHPRSPLTWDLPGGFVEPGEDLITALHRELYEEAGLNLKTAELQVIYADTIFYEKNSDGLPTSIVRIYYWSKLESIQPKIVLSWEHSDSVWTTPADFLRLLADTPFETVSKYVIEHDLVKGEPNRAE